MRKTLILTLLGVLWVVAAGAQSAELKTSVLFKSQTNLSKTYETYGIQASTLTPVVYHYSEWAIADGDRSYKKSRRYQSSVRMRNSGIVLSCIGGAFLAGGVGAMLYGIPGVRSVADGTSNADSQTQVGYFAATYGGAVASVAGLAMTIPGIVLAINGAKRMKKYKDESRKAD